MKNINKILLIIVLLFCFTSNVLIVKAEGEGDTTETGSTTGEGETPGGDTPGGETTEAKAELLDIKINGEKIVCTYGDKIICKKNINNNDVKKAEIKFSLSEGATANKESGFTIDLDEGVNKFSIKVTSSDGNKNNTYYFEITKKSLSTDSKLKSLKVNGQSINLTDDNNKYTSSVSFATKKLEIEAIPNDEKAKVLDFNENKASFDFYDNKKEIKIKVQAEDGEITTYVLTVNKREVADTSLKSLTIKNHKIDFSSDVTDYELKVLKNVSKLDITAVANSRNAKVSITNPTLQIGENTVKIEVSNDGDTTTYQIKVTKLNEDDKTLGNLKSLKIDGYDIDFSPNKYQYDLNIKDENYLKINATPKMEESEVEITGNLDLVDGSIIKIKVSYDEDIYNIYKINIIKDGTVVVKKKVSKKAIALVVCFDIISMIILGIVNLKEKLNNKKESEKQNIKVKNTKKINIDDVDII